MTGPSKALVRLGVGAVGMATAASGFIALAPAASAAPATTLTITPGTQTGAVGTCLVFTVHAADASAAPSAGQTFTVNAHPQQVTTDVDFCSAGGAAAPTVVTNGGAGADDVAKYTTDASGNAQVGVVSNQAASSAQLRAFIDTNNDNAFTAGEVTSALATANWTQGGAPGSNAAADSVNTVTVSPSTDTATPGEQRTFTATLMNNDATPHAVPGVTPNVELEGPNPAATVVFGPTACTQSDNSGQSTCTITVPSNAANGSAYTVRVYVNKSTGSGPQFEAGTDPSGTATENVQSAPTGDTITTTCAPVTSGANCSPTAGTANVTFTATVNGGAGGTTPQAGVLVSWTFSGTASTGVTTAPSPAECTTAPVTGQCSITVTVPAANRIPGNTLIGTATIRGTTIKSTSTATFTNSAADARNITLSPPSQNATSGSVASVTVKVTDSDSKPVANVNVNLSEVGAGRFAAGGGSNVVVTTGASGTASADLTTVSGETGSETVSADMTGGNQCANGAGQGTSPNGQPVSSTTTAGNCTTSGKINWGSGGTKPTTKRKIVSVKIACFSHHKHKVTCVAQLNRAIKNIKVVFYRGHSKVGSDLTNSAGKAFLHQSGLKSGKKFRYQAHANKSKTTFSATSKFASVRVK